MQVMDYPFTAEQFVATFARYNLAVWPAQVFFYVGAGLAAYLLIRRPRRADTLVALILASFWLWMGTAYHWAFFAAINPAAKLFGALFVVEAGLLAYHGLKGHLEFSAGGRDPKTMVGIGLMVFGPLIYPLVGFWSGHLFPYSPTFGLPCPTTIFTLGALLLAKRLPRHVAVIPFLWSLIGFMAAVSFGIYEDFFLLIAGLLAAWWIGWKGRKALAA